MRNPFSKASRDARMAKMQERADRIIAEQNAKGVAAQEEYVRWQASQGGGGGGVQATRAGTKSGLADLSLASVRSNARGRPELIHAAELVVIAYRDRAEYEAGRTRWRAYQDEVLHARLDRLSGQRPPLDTEYRPPPSFLSEVFDLFNPLDPMAGFPQLFNRRQQPQLGPYCGIAED